MKHTAHTISILTTLTLLWLWIGAGTAAAQTSPFGPNDQSPAYDCGVYQWPEVQSPCPEVQIKQKHDHTPKREYRAQGWDTVATCNEPTLTLSCMPYLPVQYFQGGYYVDTIPYDPPDTTFAWGIDGTSSKMPVSTDDDFAASKTAIPFHFYFFGIRKEAFVLGANGLITFDTTAAGRYCPWKFSAPLPWPNGTTGAPVGLDCTRANMRDAIYGIYEDTQPIASYLYGDQGIYYGVQGEYPCRKIICSWNGIPAYPASHNSGNRSTYQIVCYEGSNIVEVHIKRRALSVWQSGRGLLGIQNATGAPQERGTGQVSNRQVIDGSPAAFYPAVTNLLTSAIDSAVAIRFTPRGTTSLVYEWYRLFDNGDSIVLGTEDEGYGFITEMGANGNCPNLTTATVTPDTVARYVFHVKFRDADLQWYNLYDTIVIGIDKSNEASLHATDSAYGTRQLDICSGRPAHLVLEYPELQDTSEVDITLTRLNGGANTVLPDSLFSFGDLYTNPQTRHKNIPALLKPDTTALNVSPGEVDSVMVRLIVNFGSGCRTTLEFLLRTFPAYDEVESYGICQGETFHWDRDGKDYTASTTAPWVNLPTTVGCDSIVHLDLTVSDLSHHVEVVNVCKPYTWLNGHTYTETNTATFDTDTLHLQNIWGCDSILQLDFTMHSMTPLIDVDRDYIDYNNLNLVFTDVSIGGNGRTWYFSDGPSQQGVTALYTAPDNVDSVTVMMVETSAYGCIDTAYATVPFRHDLVWMPNTFVPDNEDGRTDSFHSVSQRLVKEQMLIYNRFGVLVFQCDGIDCPWDGNDLDGNPCPVGAYVYLVRYITEYEPNVTYTLKGAVTLIR